MLPKLLPVGMTSFAEFHEKSGGCNAYCRDGLHAHVMRLLRRDVGTMTEDELKDSPLVTERVLGWFTDIDEVVSVRRAHEADGGPVDGYHPSVGLVPMGADRVSYLLMVRVKGE